VSTSVESSEGVESVIAVSVDLSVMRVSVENVSVMRQLGVISGVAVMGVSRLSSPQSAISVLSPHIFIASRMLAMMRMFAM